MIPRVLAIAGSDSGGGAGIQADIKTITTLGGHAMTAITAITAQNTLGVTRVMTVPTDMVLAQIDAVVSDIGVDAIKLGMIGSAETAEAVACALAPALAEARDPSPDFLCVVFDPVMIATSGAVLADQATIIAFGKLMDIATLVTPNAPELATLTEMPIESAAQMEAAARKLAARHNVAVLAKGGHLAGAVLTDILVEASGAVTRWSDTRIDTRHNHGTGCTLSSAIATGLGAALSLTDAITNARAYVRAALLAAPELGHGHGPMGHGLGQAYFP